MCSLFWATRYMLISVTAKVVFSITFQFLRQPQWCPYLPRPKLLYGLVYWYVVNGVELFFNAPVHRPSTIYTYHVISVSAHYHIVADATQTVQQVECSTDFLGQLRLFLNKGWRLIDICIDATAIADGTQ